MPLYFLAHLRLSATRLFYGQPAPRMPQPLLRLPLFWWFHSILSHFRLLAFTIAGAPGAYITGLASPYRFAHFHDIYYFRWLAAAFHLTPLILIFCLGFHRHFFAIFSFSLSRWSIRWRHAISAILAQRNSRVGISLLTIFMALRRDIIYIRLRDFLRWPFSAPIFSIAEEAPFFMFHL